MQLPRSPACAAIISAFILPYLAAGTNLDCTKIVTDDAIFDLSKLGGPRSVMHSVDEGASFANTTYTIDICRALKPKKDAKAQDRCPVGTRRKLGLLL